MARLMFSKEGFFLTLFVVAWLVVWSMVGKPVTEGALKELEKMGLSSHALDKHQSEPYNAETVRQIMVTRKCTPMEYICADNDTQIYYCQNEKNPAKAIGLVIGRTFRQIVTGLGGKTKYWQNRCP